jgi:protein O-GlcNAc transferase
LEIQITTAEAEGFIQEGNWAVAEMVAQQYAAKDPANPASWEVLGRIAEHFAHGPLAARWHGRALELDPAHTAARAGLERSRGLPSPPAAAPGRFLLIKAWGHGFCSDLDHTLGWLLLAEMTGRTPILHWGGNSLFTEDPEHDAFRTFFEPVNDSTLDDLTGKGLDFWPPKWHDANLREENLQKNQGPYSRLSGLYFLTRPERVLVADYYVGVIQLLPWLDPAHPLHGKGIDEAYRFLIARYLRLAPDIQDRVEAFARAKMTAPPILAAHVRGSDKYKEDPQLQQKVAIYPQLIAKLTGDRWFTPIFLMTDSSTVRDDFARRYGTLLLSTDSLRTPTQVGLHLQGNPTPRRLGVEVLTDISLAARCDFFVGIGSSNVTCMVYHWKDWPEPTRLIIGPLLTHMYNPYLYLTLDQLERYLPKYVVDRIRLLK